MMCFPCSSCGTPCLASAVHSWSLDRPVCSAACAARLPPADPPSPRVALDRALELLAQGVHGVDYTLRSAGALGDRARNVDAFATVTSLAVGGVLGGLAVAAVDAGVERAVGRHQDALWAMDQHLVSVARQLMILHALGYPVAAPMRPLVVDHDELAGVSSFPSRGRLLALRELLIHLHGGVSGWRAHLDA